MQKIVILGAGFAGLHIFYKIRRLVGKKIDVTIVDPRSHSLLKPSLPEVAFQGAPISHSLIELAHTLTSRDATFICSGARYIDTSNNRIELENGDTLSYDYLVITVGAVKDYDAIEGYRAFGYSVCDDTEAQRLRDHLQDFEGGRVVTGAARSTWKTRTDVPQLMAPCEGPIGEIMFMLDHYLTAVRHLERGKDFAIDVFTPGAVFFEDVGDRPRNVVGQVMEERGIVLHKNKVLTEIGRDFIAFEDGTRMPCDLAIVIPPYRAPQFLVESVVGGDDGFIPTDTQMRHLDYPNIFAAGDITELAQPKLGHIAVIQAGIAAATLLRELGEDVEIPPHALEVFCIMNMGGHDATLIVSDKLYNGETDLAIHSPLARMMKWGFDSYLYYSKGRMPPDLAMKAMEKFVKWFE